MWKKRAILAACLGVVVIALTPLRFWSYFPTFEHYQTFPVAERCFEGDSGKLEATEIVATLDAAIRPGENTVWCASFQAAWKALETEVAGEPLTLEGDPAEAVALAASRDPRPHIPEESLCAAAGWNNKGIMDRITEELAQKFPRKPAPVFRGITPNSFVAYS